MSNTFFQGGAKNFLGGASPPLFTRLTLPECVVPLWALSCLQTESVTYLASFSLTYRVT